jgi:hypothetical protein
VTDLAGSVTYSHLMTEHCRWSSYVEDGRVVLETREQLVERIRRDVAASWTGEGSVVDELIADRRGEAAREERR